MKHFSPDMTFTALTKRSDEVLTLDSVCDYLKNDDLREVTAFLTHDLSEWTRDGEWQSRVDGKELIGVALADLDDPFAPVEILDRSQAVDLFGWRWVEDRECME